MKYHIVMRREDTNELVDELDAELDEHDYLAFSRRTVAPYLEALRERAILPRHVRTRVEICDIEPSVVELRDAWRDRQHAPLRD